MKKSALFTLAIAFLFLAGCQRKQSQPLTGGRWIDLSHDFSAETIYWPTATPFKLDTVFAGKTPKGYYYSAYQFSAAEHGGTHIDAPVHFAEGMTTVDKIPLSQLIRPAIVVDVRDSAAANRDYRVTVSDFQRWEKQHGRIPEGAIVLLRTGFGRFWPDKERYMGTAERGEAAVPKLHFPGLHPDAAKWLTTERTISAIGLDTPSIDYGQSKLFRSHQILFAGNVPAFENVANLEQLPAMGAWVIALPMKIRGGSGGPLRIVAFLPER